MASSKKRAVMPAFLKKSFPGVSEDIGFISFSARKTGRSSGPSAGPAKTAAAEGTPGGIGRTALFHQKVELGGRDASVFQPFQPPAPAFHAGFGFFLLQIVFDAEKDSGSQNQDQHGSQDHPQGRGNLRSARLFAGRFHFLRSSGFRKNQGAIAF